MSHISAIRSFEILDSRGNPTIETEVELDNGIRAKAAVPSGASTGTHEACELRDNDPKRFHGKGVLQAVKNVEEKILPAIKGKDPTAQTEIDHTMLELDGTDNKSNLGANAILSVSLAVARAAAASTNLPLYKYITSISNISPPAGGPSNPSSPSQVMPMFNVINGGLHGGGNIDFQEFMLIPDKSKTFSDSYRMGSELYQNLKKLIHEKGLPVSVGDEGGFAPSLGTNREAIQFLKDVITQSGYEYAKDIHIGLDVASSEFYTSGGYKLKEKDTPMSPFEYMQYIKTLGEEFSLYSIEDPFAEDDWETWATYTSGAAKSIHIVGDDLLVTNPKRLEKAIEKKACNSILVKVNQIGSLTETLEVVKMAKNAGFCVIMSHRSGETNDDFIADLAVGVQADLAKMGAPARGERVAKYNRLQAIYREMQA